MGLFSDSVTSAGWLGSSMRPVGASSLQGFLGSVRRVAVYEVGDIELPAFRLRLPQDRLQMWRQDLGWGVRDRSYQQAVHFGLPKGSGGKLE